MHIINTCLRRQGSYKYSLGGFFSLYIRTSIKRAIFFFGVIKIIIDGHLIGKTRVEIKMGFHIVTKSKNKAKFKKNSRSIVLQNVLIMGIFLHIFFLSLYKLFYKKRKKISAKNLAKIQKLNFLFNLYCRSNVIN